MNLYVTYFVQFRIATGHIGALEVPVESIKLPAAQTLAAAP